MLLLQQLSLTADTPDFKLCYNVYVTFKTEYLIKPEHKGFKAMFLKQFCLFPPHITLYHALQKMYIKRGGLSFSIFVKWIKFNFPM